MGDVVQETLEKLTPGLEDWLNRGIFNEKEIKAIVNKRREMEFLLRRRDVRKFDFLR